LISWTPVSDFDSLAEDVPDCFLADAALVEEEGVNENRLY
jgi:hypothetical protein